MRKKDDEKQRNIKKAVINCILKEGFHGTSMSKIAKDAGVSPATVYIYYQNKEMMLQDIYREYSEEVFYYLLSKITKNMDGKQLIEVLIKSYYVYIKDNEDIFNFVEQFSSCPALSNQCEIMKGIYNLYNLLDDMKNRKIIKNFRNDNLLAVIFSPVKEISNSLCSSEEERSEMLEEMIKIIQDALLV
jgi:AcrR family transcriptional regulator